ncbi:unnamed protein product [Mytilus edulis]|uniref:Apple domain-containing protein n=1 Tax=Mytilus edulis TaxID=6550 RepID=A0A8S3TSX1_MYTED|nr:unnamed protein product [Mytilus edulis]
MKLYTIVLISKLILQNASLTVGKYQKREENFIIESNKKIRLVNLTSVGRMSESQCANVCLQNSDNCCEITYASSTRECKLDSLVVVIRVLMTCLVQTSYTPAANMAIEGPHETDNTELNAIEIICGSRGSDRCGDKASSGQQQWGDWTGEALCPANTFLTSFSLQVQKYSVSRLGLNVCSTS